MKELLFSLTRKDFDVSWFSGKGAGGQHRNKHQNCCRIIHRESGAMGIGQNQRTRPANQKDAFNNMAKTDKFQTWLKLKVAKLSVDREEIEKLVDREMEKVKVEIREDGKWVEEQK